MWMLVCLGALASSPRVEVTPAGSVADHVARFEQHRIPHDAGRSVNDARWLDQIVTVHRGTQWHVRRFDAPHGGAVLVLREQWRGRPIAGARVVVRVDVEGQIRHVFGRVLDPTLSLRARGGRLPGANDLWWPTAAGLVAARVELGPLIWSHRTPYQERRIRSAIDGSVLAREPALHEVPAPLVGWPENPVTTPSLQTYTIELDDVSPLRTSSPQLRVYHCDSDDDDCQLQDFPTAATPDGFPDDPPPIDDVAGHQDPQDPYAAIQSFQYGTRFMDALERWGWMEPDPLPIHVNVMARDENDELVPFDGAFYRAGQIYMGQGAFADSGYDLQVLVHEIGHHVSASWGSPEPSDEHDDPGYWANDRAALNEAASDFYASLIGPSEELFVYFRNFGGLYQGPRTRHITIPFSCPQNVTGEFHMEGRIWAAAMREIHDEISMRWGDQDTFPPIFNAANVAIRQLPREQSAQFATASEIVVDELRLALGDDAADFAEGVLAERGLSSCDYAVDINDEPSVTGEGDPDDPLHARFLYLRSHDADATASDVEDHPFAPPVLHRVALGPADGGVTLRYVPDRWRTTKRVDAPLDQDGLIARALVSRLGTGLGFTRDPDTDLWSHNAQWAFDSEPDPEQGPTWQKIEITGLTPGEAYSIAVVSMSTFEPSDRRNLLLDQMQWELRPAPDDGGETTSTDGTTGESGGGDGHTGSGPDTTTGSDLGSGSSAAGAATEASASCACVTSPRAGGWWLAAIVLLAAGVRRRLRASDGEAAAAR